VTSTLAKQHRMCGVGFARCGKSLLIGFANEILNFRKMSKQFTFENIFISKPMLKIATQLPINTLGPTSIINQINT